MDESKYSVAMASALYTGPSFLLQGQAWDHPFFLCKRHLGHVPWSLHCVKP